MWMFLNFKETKKYSDKPNVLTKIGSAYGAKKISKSRSK